MKRFLSILTALTALVCISAGQESQTPGRSPRFSAEVEQVVVPVLDPSDKSRTLETWYEVAFEKTVKDEVGLFEELRYALSVEKTAAPNRRP